MQRTFLADFFGKDAAHSTVYSLPSRIFTASLLTRRWSVTMSSRISRRKHWMKRKPIQVLSKQLTLNLLTDSPRFLIRINSYSIHRFETISLFDILAKVRSLLTNRGGRLANKIIPLTMYRPKKLFTLQLMIGACQPPVSAFRSLHDRIASRP